MFPVFPDRSPDFLDLIFRRNSTALAYVRLFADEKVNLANCNRFVCPIVPNIFAAIEDAKGPDQFAAFVKDDPFTASKSAIL